VVPVWCNGAFLHRAPAISGQMCRLSMKPELTTRAHDPQTTHRPEKLASNPTSAASNATTPCTHRASCSNSPFCSSQWGPLCVPGVSLSSGGRSGNTTSHQLVAGHWPLPELLG
jgi:hypothetical protein